VQVITDFLVQARSVRVAQRIRVDPHRGGQPPGRGYRQVARIGPFCQHGDLVDRLLPVIQGVRRGRGGFQRS
jgi:hypothetical protein